MLLQQQVYTFTLTLKSDGDLPLIITAVEASAMLAKATVKSTTCIGKTAVGSMWINPLTTTLRQWE